MQHLIYFYPRDVVA